jgi:hypothetical protein
LREALGMLLFRCKGLRWLYIRGAEGVDPVGPQFFKQLGSGAGKALKVLWFGNIDTILKPAEEDALLSLAELRLLVACPDAVNKPKLGPDPRKIQQARD